MAVAFTHWDSRGIFADLAWGLRVRITICVEIGHKFEDQGCCFRGSVLSLRRRRRGVMLLLEYAVYWLALTGAFVGGWSIYWARHADSPVRARWGQRLFLADLLLLGT